jgi:SAM-dependent methyltransferase
MRDSLRPIADYYTSRIQAHGCTALGVDWNSAEGQRLRLDVLLGIVARPDQPFSLDDYGCGYGALYDLLQRRGWPADYLGFDISAEMVAAACARHPKMAGRFVTGRTSPRTADYAVASGIFNVRLARPVRAWQRHVIACLDQMHERTSRGFAFNCLTSYSDPPKRRDYLFYGDPRFFFDLCQRRYAKNVALRHDYGLYEFTILVRKAPLS